MRHHPDFPLTGAELLLVRHGQSIANARGIAQGRADYPLSERGYAQARLTASAIARLGGVEAVYSSPLTRAAETAQAIASALGLPLMLDGALVEIDVGAMSGISRDELARRHPEAVAAFETAEALRPHPRNRSAFLPGWEPPEAILARVWPAMAAIARAHPGARVAVVAHGGVLNAFLTHLLAGDATELPWRYPFGNCAIARVALAPEGPGAACVVDDSHLAALASGRSVFDLPPP